ncbi:DUF3592 domain-containing protein [Salinibacterium sp. PAMC 21357]|uniref:DUF3592 domain-containing protein n=1 Tax=Salinibacterium sp. PAMC 21357 TaxID=1112215 RepID=UPI000289DE6A|nr:DUF3592 domain-containing protein [Salinibacterium sp. PAMC 21357]
MTDKTTPGGRFRKPITPWTVIRVIVIPLLVLIFVVFVIVNQGDDRADILENGVATQALPTGGTVSDTSRNNGRTKRWLSLEFRYMVDGEIYTTAGDHKYDRNSFDKTAALNANPSAEVRYREDDPSTAIVLDKDYR